MNPFFEISHHGAINGVTGSCQEQRLSDGPSMLVDCCLFQGAETSDTGAGADKLKIDFPIQHVQTLVLSRVHIDQGGALLTCLPAASRAYRVHRTLHKAATRGRGAYSRMTATARVTIR